MAIAPPHVGQHAVTELDVGFAGLGCDSKTGSNPFEQQYAVQCGKLFPLTARYKASVCTDGFCLRPTGYPVGKIPLKSAFSRVIVPDKPMTAKTTHLIDEFFGQVFGRDLLWCLFYKRG